MKKLLFMAGVIACAALVAPVAATANVTGSAMLTEGWAKAKDGLWAGKDKVWYKLNPKDATIWWSKDGKEWAKVENGMWQDHDGKWLKISDKKLVWSADGGKTWAEVPEWTWEGTNGMWYKFDKDWTLWSKKG